MNNSWIVLMPSLIVLVCVCILRRLNTSLCIGILTAVAIAADGNPLGMFQTLKYHFMVQVQDIDYLYLYSFLLILGMIIALISQTGGARAIAQLIAQKARSRTSIETASLFLSLALFLDDYLSNLTVGYVMHPLTDRLKIPRVKLAFLVHSMASPIVILAPVSSWVAMITSQLSAAGIDQVTAAHTKIIADPFFIYLSSVPFIFYSFFITFSVFVIVRKRISYGPMQTQELIARDHDNLFGGKSPLAHRLQHEYNSDGTLADLIVPLTLLIALVFLGILYTGDYWIFGGHRGFIHALQNNHKSFLILLSAAALTFLCSTAWSLKRKRITPHKTMFIIKQGVLLMYPSLIVILLASTLGNILRTDLQVGTYLATTLLSTIHIALLPLVFFIISFIIAMLTNSWGTIAILLPITIQMLTNVLETPLPTTPEQIVMLLPVLGSIFSGAVCGDHISPLSETTTMASTSCGAYPFDHVYTQFPYAIPAIVACCFSYLLTGMLSSYTSLVQIGSALASGIVICLLLLYSGHYFYPTSTRRE
jgi:tetracycline resistance efflux pump